MANETITCSECKAQFQIKRGEYLRQLRRRREHFFCSRSCAAFFANRPRIIPPVEKKCARCGAVFVTSGRPRLEADFCSRSCASAGSVTDYRRARAVEMGRLSANSGNLMSAAEVLKLREHWKYKLIAEHLERLGVPHEFEFEIKPFIYDLALTRNKVLVEFDGPEHSVAPVLKRDAERDAWAAQMGWRVVRVAVKSNSQVTVSDLVKVI